MDLFVDCTTQNYIIATVLGLGSDKISANNSMEVRNYYWYERAFLMGARRFETKHAFPSYSNTYVVKTDFWGSYEVFLF